MRFWIAVTALVVVLVLMARAVLGRRGAIHTAGPREGYDVGLQGIWSARHASSTGSTDAGGRWGGWGGEGWDGGDGGGGE